MHNWLDCARKAKLQADLVLSFLSKYNFFSRLPWIFLEFEIGWSDDSSLPHSSYEWDESSSSNDDILCDLDAQFFIF